MRLISMLLIAVLIGGSTPVAASADSTASGCPTGRKTEHFPTVDLWDVVRLIGADYHVNLQPALTLPHVNIDTDLSCYSRAQAVAFLQGLSLQLVPVGPRNNPVYMVYPSSEAQRLVGTVRSYRLRYAAADADVLKQVTDALPADAYVAVRTANNTIIVSGSSYVLQRADQIIQALDVPLQTEVVTVPLLSGVKATDVVASLAPRLPPNSLVANASNNSVIVSGTADTVAVAQRLLHSMDADILQVKVDFKVVDDFPQNDSSSIGVRVGGVDAQGNATPGSGSTIVNIPGFSLKGNVSIDLNSTKGFIDISDAGNLTINNNVEATLNDATDYPFTFSDPLTGIQTKDQLIGLVVDVTPSISQDGKRIVMALNIQDSDFGGYTPQNQPIAIERKASTSLTTTDGVPVVIGGIFENMDVESTQSIPLLSRIPLLGALFRYRQTTKRKGNFMLVITPHVVKSS